MCNCTGTCSGSCVIDLTGIGQKGDTGSQGGYGGYSSAWNFSTSTTSGTTSGQLRFNSATYASVTTIYVNKTNRDTTDLSNFLASLSNGTYYGKVRIFKESDSSKFWEGTITAVSAGVTEYTITVSYILANSTFVASDSVVLSFTPHGLGAKPLAYSYYQPLLSTGTTGSWTSPGSEATFTIAANTLQTDGDMLEVIIRGIFTGSGTDALDGIRCLINSDVVGGTDVTYMGIVGDELLHHSGTSGAEYELKISIERYDSTNVIVYFTGVLSGIVTLTGATSFNTTVNNLTTNSNTFSVQVYQGASGDTVTVTTIKAVKYLQ